MGTRLLAALDAVRGELDLDPLFRGKRYTVAELEALLRQGPDDDLAALFSHTLQGMTQSARYGGIKVVHQLHAAAREHTRLPDLTIPKGETRVFIGDLRIDGDVDNNGILVVTGDLEIAGRYIGPVSSYSLAAVGGTMKARHVTTSGEVLVGRALEATGVVHFVYNDYSSLLPRLTARALIVDDNFPVLGEVIAVRVNGHASDDQLREWFGGIPSEDDEESSVRAMMLAGWQPKKSTKQRIAKPKKSSTPKRTPKR